MAEAAQLLAFLSALLLAGAVAIWAKRLRGPLLQRLDGTRASNVRPAEIAAQVLVIAMGVASLAALLAILGWIVP